MAAGKNLQDALNETKAECIFTTHTPVEAGHDRFSPDLMDYAMHRFRAQISAPFSELMKLGRVNPQRPARAVLHDRAGAEALSRRQCRQRTAWPRQPPHVALPLPGQTGRAGAHRPHYQRHSLAGLDEGHRAPVSAAQADRPSRSPRWTANLRAGFSDWEKRVEKPEFWKLLAHPEFVVRRGTLGSALQAPAGTHRVCPAAPADPAPALDPRRLHRLRPTAQSRRADHRLCAPVRHLQARAAHLPAVREHREADAGQGPAHTVCFRRQSPSAR